MRAHLTPSQTEFLPERVMVENQTYIPPISRQYQIKLEKADTLQEQISILAEWAMRTGFCNNILENAPKAYDKLSLIRRGVTI